MRIVFLTPRLPHPPEGGDRYRVFHILRRAAEAGHEVHLLSFDTQPRDEAALSPLRRLAASVEIVNLPAILSRLRAVAALPGDQPLQVAYYGSRRMAACMRALIDRVRPDVVYTHLFRMAPYALENQMPSTRWILDLTDVISDGIRRSLPYRRGPNHWLYTVEGRRIRRYEQAIAARFDACWVISEAEARGLAAIAPGARIEVVPNGVERFAPAPGVARDGAKLLFFAFHRVFHNRDAAQYLAREVFPRVRAAHPQATLDIAGRGAESLGRWSQGAGIRNLGYLTEPGEALARAAIFVAPHRFAAGVQNKVVQALAHGLPVVTTPVVGRGLEPIPGDVLRVAEGADALAAATVALLRDPETATALAARGRAWAQGRFTWDASLRALESGAFHNGESHPARERVALAV